MAKVQISLDEDLLQRIDKHADSLYMSRSGFISYACAQLLNTSDMMLAIHDLSLAIRKIADTGTISEEDKETLEDFERLVKLITSAK